MYEASFCLWGKGWQKGLETRQSEKKDPKSKMLSLDPSGNRVCGRFHPSKNNCFPICLGMLIYSWFTTGQMNFSPEFIFVDVWTLITISFSRWKCISSTWPKSSWKGDATTLLSPWNLIVYLQFQLLKAVPSSHLTEQEGKFSPNPGHPFLTSEMPLPVLLGPPLPIPYSSESFCLSHIPDHSKRNAKSNINKILITVSYVIMC